MERMLARSGRRVLARAAVAGVMIVAAVPAAAGADKPTDGPGNGPPGPVGNPNHEQAQAAPGRSAQAPRGRAVRSHGAPAHGGTPPGRSGARHSAQRPPKPHPAATADRHGTAATPSTQTHANNGAAHQKTTICHATGSATNPYVQITISDRALKAHARHQDGRDIIPAPAGGCPASASGAEQAASSTQAASAVQAAPAVGAAIETAGASAPSPTTGKARGSEPESQVMGVVQTNRTATAGHDAAPAASTGPLATTERAGDDGTLPFTGLNVVLALVIAGGLILAGVAMRRAASARRTAA